MVNKDFSKLITDAFIKVTVSIWLVVVVKG